MSKFESVALLSIYGLVLIIMVGALLSCFIFSREKKIKWGEQSLFSPHGKWNQVSTEGLVAFDLFGVALLVSYFSMSLMVIISATDSKTPLPSPSMILLGGMITGTPALLVYLRLFVFRKGNEWRRQEPIQWKRTGVTILVFMAAIYAVSYLYEASKLSELLQVWMKSAKHQDVVIYLMKGSVQLKLAMGFTAVILAPITEELFFRGYIYPVLKKFGGMIPALIFSSLFFGLVHGNIVAFPVLALFGAVLVLLYEYTKTLWAPIIAHFIFNATTVIAICVFNVQP